MERKQEAERGSRKGDGPCRALGQRKSNTGSSGRELGAFGEREARLAKSLRKQVVAQDEIRKVGRGGSAGT